MSDRDDGEHRFLIMTQNKFLTPSYLMSRRTSRRRNRNSSNWKEEKQGKEGEVGVKEEVNY